MQIHELRKIYKRKYKKRVGRGGKKGTYCGRGIKGQRARAGRRLKPMIREIIKKYPKLRGFKFKAKKQSLAIINAGILEKHFKVGDLISPKTLLEKKIIRKILGKLPQVKILGKGEIKKALTIKDCLLSKSAREKIKKAGGIIK